MLVALTSCVYFVKNGFTGTNSYIRTLLRTLMRNLISVKYVHVNSQNKPTLIDITLQFIQNEEKGVLRVAFAKNGIMIKVAY